MIDWDRLNTRGTSGYSPIWYFAGALTALIAAIGLFIVGQIVVGAIMLVFVPLQAHRGWQSYCGENVWGTWRLRK